VSRDEAVSPADDTPGDESASAAGRPAFSVVIPAFNAQDTLAASMRSVLQQSEPDLELIVVDDGSSDDTLALARTFTDRRVTVATQPNAGPAAARNRGISLARAPIVAFLDRDDLLLPSYLRAVKETFAADPQADFVYSDAWTFDDATRRVRRQTTAYYQHPPQPPPATAWEMFRELLLRNFIIVPVAVRRDVIVAAGMFDEKMLAAQDWDMWLRLSAAGHRGTPAPGPLGLRREHAAQISKNPLRIVSNHVYMLERLLREQELAPEDAARVSARLAQAHREHRTLTGEDRLRAAALRSKVWLSVVKTRLGLGARWYRQPPAPVTDAFGDLTSLR
jgi:glycosyltransferase involved in cell wall biosynthesis